MPRTQNAIEMTVRWLDRLALPATGRIEYWDSVVHGLGLRVSATGRKTWMIFYRVKGERQMRRLTIGTYPQLGLADARDLARETTNRANAGEDPAAEKQELKAAPTIAWLASEYIEKYALPRKRSARRDESILRLYVLPAWGQKRVHEVRRRDVVDLVEGIAQSGKPIQANRTLACIRKMFNWGLSRDLLEANPCAQVKAPSEERQRDRVLSEGELRALWRAIEDLPTVTAALFKLRILTAQRGGEVETMRWQDVDLNAGWWTIPAERAKNKLSHRVPLSPPALQVLKAVAETTGSGVWVFPGLKGSHIKDYREALQKIREASGIEFVPHDLRRTAASHMTSIGIPRLVVSKILNHVEQGITRVYDRHSYDREKRDALDAWGDRLTALTGGERKP